VAPVATATPVPASPPPQPVVVAAPLRRGSWHARAVGGWAFRDFGTDAPDDGPHAGVDVGHTWGSGWGVDALYRYSSAKFPVAGNPTLAADGGDFHTVGVKLTYEVPIGADCRWRFFAGAGPTYTFSSRFEESGDGFGGFGTLGLGYCLSRQVSLEIAVEGHGFETDVGSRSGEARWVWSVAPVVGIRFDF
jgi:hypothetical protein